VSQSFVVTNKGLAFLAALLSRAPPLGVMFINIQIVNNPVPAKASGRAQAPAVKIGQTSAPAIAVVLRAPARPLR
jgi:hypothetical protein